MKHASTLPAKRLGARSADRRRPATRPSAFEVAPRACSSTSNVSCSTTAQRAGRSCRSDTRRPQAESPGVPDGWLPVPGVASEAITVLGARRRRARRIRTARVGGHRVDVDPRSPRSRRRRNQDAPAGGAQRRRAENVEDPARGRSPRLLDRAILVAGRSSHRQSSAGSICWACRTTRTRFLEGSVRVARAAPCRLHRADENVGRPLHRRGRRLVGRRQRQPDRSLSRREQVHRDRLSSPGRVSAAGNSSQRTPAPSSATHSVGFADGKDDEQGSGVKRDAKCDRRGGQRRRPSPSRPARCDERPVLPAPRTIPASLPRNQPGSRRDRGPGAGGARSNQADSVPRTA